MSTLVASLRRPSSKAVAWLSAHSLTLLEIGLIIVWAMWVARSYVNTDPYLWPAGSGMGGKVIGHHFWNNIKQCGLCALWNGSYNGGRPALADVFGSQFHPLVAITTLLWGTIGGAKLTIVGSLALAGIAQWWISRSLRLGRIATLWSSFIAVAGGHLAIKNDEGNIGVLLATASCSLAIAAALSLGVNRQRQQTIWLALMGFLALVSGQGYMQFTLIAWAPAIVFLLIKAPNRKWLASEYILAVIATVLLAGFVLVPLAHFWPYFTKDTADPNFPFSQPLEYLPLNLVIRDWVFYDMGGILGKPAHHDLMYIGWIPVMFSLLSIRFIQRENWAPLTFLASGAFLSMFVGSAIPLRAMAETFPFVLGFRFTSPMQGLAIPPILALAGFGLDQILKLNIPKLEVGFTAGENRNALAFDARWLLVIPLLISVKSVYQYSNPFYATRDLTDVYQGISALKTEETQWVSPPVGETDFMEPSIGSGLKLTYITFSGAYLAGYEVPLPNLLVERNTPPENSELYNKDLLLIPIFRIPANQYAYVVDARGQRTPCKGYASSGNIRVDCDTPEGGQLFVQENALSGWRARIDGQAAPLLRSQWLSVEIPAGKTTSLFNYRPLDALFGILLTLGGIVLLIGLGLPKKQIAEN